MNRKQYEEDLKERQRLHLENVNRNRDQYWTPCMHDSCPQCVGTGIKFDGSVCIHMMHCSCSKCSPSIICTRIDPSIFYCASSTWTTTGDTQCFGGKINEFNSELEDGYPIPTSEII